MEKFKVIVKRVLIFISVTVALLVAGLYAIMWICVNGPSWVAGDLFVLSVRETSAAGFLADIYCSEEEIKEIEERNKVEKTDEITDTSIVKVEHGVKNDIKDDDTKNDSADKEENNKAENGIIIEEVVGNTYKGVMMIIEDPSRVIVGALDEYGADKRGKTVSQFIEEYGAIGGSNAGGFEDTNGTGSGGIPDGIVIAGGELKWGNPGSSYEIIGFTNEDILVVGNMTGQKAMDMGIRDAVSFGPILIVNGVPNKIGGTGGGLNPRTAIGQRSDGAVLLLVIDGRQASSLGASMNDLINVMLEYGAVNAANLDGGSSSVLRYKGESLNVNSSLVGMRKIPTTILVK